MVQHVFPEIVYVKDQDNVCTPGCKFSITESKFLAESKISPVSSTNMQISAQMKSKTPTFLEQLDEQIKSINDSKIFAGLMIITLNVVSRFVNIKLSKTMESYLKFTLSKQLLVFTIAWMGSRDIYIALIVTACFILLRIFIQRRQHVLCVIRRIFRLSYSKNG